MAGENPTCGRRAVPVDLPADQIAILRSDLESWRHGVLADLAKPELLTNPDDSRREAAVYDRLLAGLDRGDLLVPDEIARQAIEAAAKAHDDEFNYKEVAAIHDAHHALLSLLGGAKT